MCLWCPWTHQVPVRQAVSPPAPTLAPTTYPMCIYKLTSLGPALFTISPAPHHLAPVHPAAPPASLPQSVTLPVSSVQPAFSFVSVLLTQCSAGSTVQPA